MSASVATDAALLSIADATRLPAARKLSAVELTRAFLDEQAQAYRGVLVELGLIKPAP